MGPERFRTLGALFSPRSTEIVEEARKKSEENSLESRGENGDNAGRKREVCLAWLLRE